MTKVSLTSNENKTCPICDQRFWSGMSGSYYRRGDEVICDPCWDKRGSECRAWIDGWDMAIKWKDGQAE